MYSSGYNNNSSRYNHQYLPGMQNENHANWNPPPSSSSSSSFLGYAQPEVVQDYYMHDSLHSSGGYDETEPLVLQERSSTFLEQDNRLTTEPQEQEQEEEPQEQDEEEPQEQDEEEPQEPQGFQVAPKEKGLHHRAQEFDRVCQFLKQWYDTYLFPYENHAHLQCPSVHSTVQQVQTMHEMWERKLPVRELESALDLLMDLGDVYLDSLLDTLVSGESPAWMRLLLYRRHIPLVLQKLEQRRSHLMTVLESRIPLFLQGWSQSTSSSLSFGLQDGDGGDDVWKQMVREYLSPTFVIPKEFSVSDSKPSSLPDRISPLQDKWIALFLQTCWAWPSMAPGWSNVVSCVLCLYAQTLAERALSSFVLWSQPYRSCLYEARPITWMASVGFSTRLWIRHTRWFAQPGASPVLAHWLETTCLPLSLYFQLYEEEALLGTNYFVVEGASNELVLSKIKHAHLREWTLGLLGHPYSHTVEQVNAAMFRAMLMVLQDLPSQPPLSSQRLTTTSSKKTSPATTTSSSSKKTTATSSSSSSSSSSAAPTSSKKVRASSTSSKKAKQPTETSSSKKAKQSTETTTSSRKKTKGSPGTTTTTTTTPSSSSSRKKTK